MEKMHKALRAVRYTVTSETASEVLHDQSHDHIVSNPRSPLASRNNKKRNSINRAAWGRRAYSLSIDPEELQLLASGALLQAYIPTILGTVIRPTKSEVTNRKIQLSYSPRQDEYRRPTDVAASKQKGWNSLAYSECNMELVTEHRQMAGDDKIIKYLARTPGAVFASIQWKFDFSISRLRVKKLALKLVYETVDDGVTRVWLRPDCATLMINPADDQIAVFASRKVKEIPEAHGWSKFSLTAEMSCRRGSCTFKHSKLFSQEQKGSLFESAAAKSPLIIEIWLE